ALFSEGSGEGSSDEKTSLPVASDTTKEGSAKSNGETGGSSAVDQSQSTALTTDASENSRHITHSKKLRMAALNYPFTGDMHGVRGADYECFRQSRRANLKGTFRAFMAARVQNIDSIVRSKDAKLPVVNLRDEILFNSWRDIFTGSGAPFAYPPKIYSFDGRNIFTDSAWSQKLVWHGADKNGVRNTDAYCDAWGSNSISRMGVASNLVHGKLLDQVKYSCNNQFIVLCVEVSPEESSSSSSSTRHRRQSGHVHHDHQ
ncbi:PREDICTED: collagen alpha-1(XV) chain-like, partial [Rhagoletis zephyria]|uniref:collagen alpha-1(XV) chain-like n=1 Tax=Rhagoletis zephyria TaxID=28612 RepID=UPI0008118E4D